NVVQRIIDWCTDQIAKLGAELRGDKDAAFLVDMRRMYENALRSAQSGEASGTEQYSIKNTRTMSWQDQVNGYFEKNGSIQSSDSLYLGTSGMFLEEKGISDSPLYIPLSVINKAIRDAHGSKSGHELTQKNIADLKVGIENAPAVIYNRERNALVYITDLQDKYGNYIVATFNLNEGLHGEAAHRATSIHGRESVPAMLQGLGADATIFVANKNKFNEIADRQSGHSPELLANVELIDDSVAQPETESNPQNAVGRNFQELSDDVFEELTRSEPPEAEDRSVMERLRQKDPDEYWEEVERLADAIADEDDANMDPNPDPEDLVQTDVQREKVPVRQKIEDVRSFIARKFFDAGDAVTQIQKQTGDRHLYSYFNQARASANAAVQMIEGNRFDTLGRNTGDGLNKVLETVRSKGAEYYKDFQLYLLHMHNIDRMQRENPERVDAARASFERFKAENPDLAQFADYQISRMAAEETSPYYFVAGEYMRYLQAMQRAGDQRFISR
ncbi:MAG: hypothetical protein IKA78_01310, partial [Oscillospiraceae bacterium]|nr:hypothetical protein [Oscillospiraceae bacterium]